MESSFAKKQPIDGNAILAQIAAEKSRFAPGQGAITDHNTGQVLAQANGAPGVDMPMPVDPKVEKAAMQNEAYDDMDREMIYAQEMAEGGDPSAMQQQLQGGSEYMDEQEPPFTPQELKETQKQYLNTAGQFSNFAEQNGMDMNELLSRMPEEFTKEDLDMFRDSRKIKTKEDAIKVGMMGDYMADFMDLDTKELFNGSGVMRKCGEECQMRRAAQNVNPLAQNDQDFMAMNSAL